MPEGVEVCWTALWLNSLLKNATIINIKTLRGKYKTNPIKNISSVNNTTINNVDSKGKLLYIKLAHNTYIVFNFGLTGIFTLTKNKYSNQEITFEKNNVSNKLYYNDVLSFGTIRICNEKEFIKIINMLADDFLKDNIKQSTFIDDIQSFNNQSIYIADILLDQTYIGSGIGVYLLSEILHNAKIKPNIEIKNLPNNQIIDLFKSIKYIFKLSYLTNDAGYYEKMDSEQMKFIHKIRNSIKNNPDSKYNYLKNVNIHNNTFKYYVYKQKDSNKYRTKTNRIIYY